MITNLARIVSNYLKNPKGTEALVIKLEHSSAFRFFRGQQVPIDNDVVVLSLDRAKEIYIRLYDALREFERRKSLVPLRQRRLKEFLDEKNKKSE